eukprot:TRINITY_DN15823_c0_g3_i1.p1 TRINITY_DN15823_c0_g3~~TRINITY_DN15823_c0_g3_i1.p1  ORF type:complete len:771 (-),score=136.14 TRINITY_DN15823_c0_g3_i1:445-2460(-)
MALHWCAVYGCITPAQMLIGKVDVQQEIQSVDEFVKVPDKDNNTILHLAVKHNQTEFIKWMISTFSQGFLSLLASVQNRLEQTPLHLACSRCSLQTIELIYNLNKDMIQQRDGLNLTPVQIAEQETKNLYFLQHAQQIKQQGHSDTGAVVVTSTACMKHLTCDHPIQKGTVGIPPENVGRLMVLLHPERGSLRSIQNIQIEEECKAAELSDVLRIHHWKYVMQLQQACQATEDEWQVVQLDGDTSISRGTLSAALKGCGAVMRGVDLVIQGVRRVFCAIRPPGHHAGPGGKVRLTELIDVGGEEQEEAGGSSHGFCIFNNVAVGAAYAMNVYREFIKRVVILDIDVHHGNGTQACVLSTVPRRSTHILEGPTSRLEYDTYTCLPWLGFKDQSNILFASVQAFGSGFYPGTGATDDTQQKIIEGEFELVEDPEDEFVYEGGGRALADGPRVINVGIPGPGIKAKMWQRAWRDKIFPAVLNFSPDIIFISAGFDAHRKDSINDDFIGLTERHFEWITDEIVQVANRCCLGRVVSVLEGGYAIQGGAVSAFARSVQIHVQTLAAGSNKKWNPEEAEIERQKERVKKEERLQLQREQQVMMMQEAELLAREIDQDNLIPKSNKRSRTSSLDYAALNRQWEEQLHNQVQEENEIENVGNKEKSTAIQSNGYTAIQP